MHEKQIEIRWRDQDAYGHVNNAVYLTYLEEVRDEWLERALGDAGDAWGYVTARVAIDFRRELTQDDDAIVARLWLTRIGTSSVTTREEIVTVGGELAAEAEAVLVARDTETGRSRPLTDVERAALERELGACALASPEPACGSAPSSCANRIVSTAHQTTLVHDHLPTDEFVAYHEARAAGGTGMIVLEATAVHESGRLTAHTLAGYVPEIVAGYRRVADGGPPARDAALRPALPRRPGADRQPAAAGRGRAVGDPEPALPRRATRADRRAEIDEIVAGYARSAELAAEGGLDGIELSAAHNYLFAQFFTPGLNLREDEWAAGTAASRRGRGGRAERRRRGSRSACGSRPTPKPPSRSRPSSPGSSTTSRSHSATLPPIAARRESSRRLRSRRARSPASPRRSRSARL